MILRKYCLALLGLLTIGHPAAWSQNLPKPEATAPSGPVTEITPPVLPYLWGGINYTLTSAPMIPMLNVASMGAPGSPDLKENYVFRDGFNRVYQTVVGNVSKHNGTFRSVVQINDTRFQRDQIQFLPYTDIYFALNNYTYNQQRNYYAGLYPGEGYTSYSRTANISNAGSYTTVSYAPGKSRVGQGRGIATTLITNAVGEVRIWDIDGSGLPVSTGSYAANQLFGEEVTAPGDNSTLVKSRIYNDKDGRVVLKMVADSMYSYGSGVLQTAWTYQSTYYVYDEMGHLRYILPPRAVALAEASGWTLTGNRIDNLCFQYRYDAKGRMSAMRKPGEEGFTYFVYDRKQRPVMKQTPQETTDNHYEVTLYDKLNRIIATAMYTDLSSPADWQNFFDTYNGTLGSNDIRYYMGYPNEGLYPPQDGISNITILGYNYYDNYEQVDPGSTLYNDYNGQLAFTELQSTPGAEIPTRSLRTQGLPTGSKVRILSSASANQINTGNWSWNHSYYDDKGRVISALKRDFSDQGGQIHYNYMGRQYDFMGRPLISKSIFQNLYANASVYTELYRNEYEAGTGSLLRTSHKIGTAPWAIVSSLGYDSMGRVKRKVLGNYGEVQDMSYNIRGELTGINGVYAETGDKAGESRTFGESIKYDYGFSIPQYGGKITGMIWRGNGTSSHAYGYSYDVAGRLKNAEFRTNTLGPGWNKSVLDYTVSNINYDKNGNLRSMDQQGVTPASGIQTIDKLRYTYGQNEESNQLLRVTDDMPDYGLGDFVNTNGNNSDYVYDANGNLASDANKGIEKISYTYFNKPGQILFTNGNSIEYSYDAAGNKVQELVKKAGQADKVTDYIGDYVYEGNVLRYIQTAEGRSVRDNGNNTFKEEFFVKDHLGNIRSTIDVIQKPILQYLATYELASANLEGLLFDQVNEIRSDKPGSTDPNDVKSGKLNGQDQPIGTSLLMHVMAGDQVEMNVNNYYDSYDKDDDSPLTPSNMLASIVSTLTGGVGGFQGSEGHNPDMVQRLFTPDNYLEAYRSIQDGRTDATRPRAYLNYVLFDENMRIDKSFSNAFQVNSNGSWEQIGTTAPLTIPSNGYLAIFLSNESKGINCYNCTNVHFDRMVIRLQKGRQLEEAHYYPFGLPMAGLSSPAENNTIPQRRKYQGNEYIKDLGLNWMDFHARQYDPQTGRFLGVDPLANSGGQEIVSPYAAMGNAPESMIDPDGRQNVDFRPNNRVVKDDPGGVATSFKAFVDAFGKSWGDAGSIIGGGGGGLENSGGWQGNNTGANGLTEQNQKEEQTKTLEQLVQEASATPGQPAYNYGEDPNVMFMGKDQYGNNTYVYFYASSVGVAAYTPKDDPYKKMNEKWNNFASGVGKTIWWLSASASALEKTAATYRIFSEAYGLSPWIYPQGYPATPNFNQHSVGKAGKAFGKFLARLSIGIDAVSVYNGQISHAKFIMNTAVNLFSMTGVGTAFSIIYFGVDAFVPGGWRGFSEEVSSVELRELRTTGHPALNNSATKL